MVAEVEQQVAELLGAEAAVLLPSGTLAQQAAVRVHADARHRRTVVLHPSSHLLLWEQDALTALHRLEPVPVGDPWGLPTVDELTALQDAAAVVVELPQRETGGHLLPLADLTALSTRLRASGTALHLDGARLWECGPAYGGLAPVAALADSVYVSLYKGLGGLAGAVLVGAPDVVEGVRTWRTRHGGTLPVLWPLALGARRGLRERLPRVPEHLAWVQGLAVALGDRGVPVATPPVVPLLHAVLDAQAERVVEALLDVAERSGVWLGGAARRRPDGAGVEVHAGPASHALGPDEAADLLAEVERVARQGG